MGFDGDVIEVALAHLGENEIRAAYNRAKYWPQRVALLQARGGRLGRVP
jgi:hypothetical protein